MESILQMYILETFFHDIRIIKQIIKHIGSQSRLRDSKPRNNALHAFCGIETMELPLGGSHKKSVFESRSAPSRQHL